MSLDTRDGRASAVAGGLLWLVVAPVPDGSLADVEDRRHLAGLYRAFEAAAPAAAPTGPLSLHEHHALWIREAAAVRIDEHHRVWLREEPR